MEQIVNMLEWIGYWLDDYTFVSPLANTFLWVKITLEIPRDKTTNKITFRPGQHKLFSIEYIDPKRFEYNGEQVKLTFGE